MSAVAGPASLLPEAWLSPLLAGIGTLPGMRRSFPPSRPGARAAAKGSLR